VHSEGDLCPGVVADVYGAAAVLDLTTGGTEAWVSDREAGFQEAFSPERVVVRLTGEQRDQSSRSEAKPSFAKEGPESGPDGVAFDENGLHFVADVSSGQK